MINGSITLLSSTPGLAITCAVLILASSSCAVFVSITIGLLVVNNGESRDDFDSTAEFLSIMLSGAILLNFLSGDRGRLGEEGQS